MKRLLAVPGNLPLALGMAAILQICSCSSPRTLDGVVRATKAEPTGTSYPIPGVKGVEHIEANWKERLAQPYVYLERRGDYRLLGDAMRSLFAAAESLGFEVSGAPFALFFDDPGRVDKNDLRARVCLPVGERPGRLGDLQFDVLPRAMVVYARVAGAYPEVARSYPALFAYLRELGWRQGGPIREAYLVNPVDAADYEDLLTEVQIPWVAGGP